MMTAIDSVGAELEETTEGRSSRSLEDHCCAVTTLFHFSFTTQAKKISDHKKEILYIIKTTKETN